MTMPLAHPQLHPWPPAERDALPMALWTSAEIERATGGRASHVFSASGVEIDSRDVRPGDVFVALKGQTTDGHRFVPEAYAKGAVAAIVDRPVDGPHVLVADTAAALRALGSFARERCPAIRIGITGSVGKTGMKEAIFACLDRASRGAAHRSLRSHNNHVGVPLSLARLPARAKFAVFEIGMNHRHEIAPLTAQVRPHVALITTIAPAHIENLGSLAAIAEEKADIFTGLVPGGTAIIPADSEWAEYLISRARAHATQIVTFGCAAKADVRLLDAIPAAGGGALVTADLGDRRICYHVAEPGEHWIVNSLAVMAAVRAAGADLGAAGLALAEMASLKGRGARHTIAVAGGKALLIDESYNANPASMRATLKALGQTSARRRLAVLGSMKELGDFADAFHRQLAQPLAEAGVTHAILVGEEMRALAEELGKLPATVRGKPITFAHCASCAEAIEALEQYGLAPGDAVLVKGSNAVGLGRLVSHFAGRAAATQAGGQAGG